MFKNISRISFLLPFLLLLPFQASAFVPLICDLCTIGVIAGLGVSRYFGIDDSVTGVWIGALLVVIIQMTLVLLEKKNINFRFRTAITSLSFVVFTLISFYYAGVIGIYGNTFFGSTSILLDKVLLSSFAGGILLVLASSGYQILKKRNSGHAHFPFEKVVLPIASLTILSLIFYFITAR